MLADALYAILPYQIFKSILFRSGAAFLFSFFGVSVAMPFFIYWLRKNRISADFSTQILSTAPSESRPNPQHSQPYAGPKLMMGGVVLVAVLICSTLLWVDINPFIVALLLIVLAFAAIGGWDDVLKVRHRRQVETGVVKRAAYAEKADGLSGRLRLALQFLVAGVVIMGLDHFVEIDGHLVFPFIPLKWWHPYLPSVVFIPFMLLVIVSSANAVNLTDGMDSLVSAPLITCALFAMAAAYVGSSPEWALHLRLPVLPVAVREVVVVGSCLVGACMSFLRFNAPPAMITMGDVGALSLGSLIGVFFIYAKVEVFLPLVGGVFVLMTLSTIIQRLFFKLMLAFKGRRKAEEVRFFYRAPYHHHLQALWQYTNNPSPVCSVWVMFLERLGVFPPAVEDRLVRPEDVNSRVIWRLHLWSVWLFVIALVVYFKVR